MKRKLLIGVLLMALGALGGMLTTSGQDASDAERYEGTFAAPEFPSSVDWLNVDDPLTLDGLRGKIVMLDFWTYGCINCIHMIPILQQLEERYADELVVIGVHSAKFENEGQTENIAQIVQRYNVHHPVINDSNFEVWQSYGIPAWPTFVIIDPRGNVVAAQSGEVPFEAFDQYFAGMIEYYDTQVDDVEINREPLELALEGASNPGTPLLFPGKVLADAAGGRLFIADTNHHRIVIADLTTYEVLDIIGAGQRGYREGDFDTAQFDQPQGMELVGNTLYVADVNNHTIRAVDLSEENVTTVAGTGRLGSGIAAFSTVYPDPLTADLRSPWDVELGDDDRLYIAMAGTHQIWQMNLETGALQAAVGDGREAQLNATLATSQLAQPSGLHYHEGDLYFADSESSTIRLADIPGNTVRVVSGTTQNNLFDFGDSDGRPGQSRLQHALGITGNEDGTRFYIADTYNHKIKIYDPETDETRTFYSLGGSGFRDGFADIAQFSEPGGLDYANGLLYVADTNNHAIRVIDTETGMVETVQFPNPEALIRADNDVTIVGGNAAAGESVRLETQTVAAGAGTIDVMLTLPDGYKINDLTESYVKLFSVGDVDVNFDVERIVFDEVTFSIPATFTQGDAEAELSITLFYCEAQDEAFCLIDEVNVSVPLSVTADAESSSVGVERDVQLPEGFAGL